MTKPTLLEYMYASMKKEQSETEPMHINTINDILADAAITPLTGFDNYLLLRKTIINDINKWSNNKQYQKTYDRALDFLKKTEMYACDIKE